MPINILLLAYLVCFIFLAWKNFRLAIGWLILCLPAYLIRFNFGPLPSTLLEINFAVIFIIWLIRYFKTDWLNIKSTIKQNKTIFVFVGFFLLSTIVSIFWGAWDDPVFSRSILKATGIWRAYFLEPLLLFFVLIGRNGDSTTNKSKIKSNDLVKFLVISGLSVGLLAIVQKITGYLYSPSLWDDVLNGRVTSFFTSPNAIGLYLSPLVALLAILLLKRKEEKFNFLKITLYILLLLIILTAIIFSFSQGAWVALGVAFVFCAIIFGYKKIAIFTIMTAVIMAWTIPSLKEAVTFNDQAGRNRLELWKYSAEYLTTSPTNFIFGSGLRQFFNEVQRPHYDVKKMERLIYPHNLLLNFWLETGLLGMISFVGILICASSLSILLCKKNLMLGAGFLLALLIIFIHGLVDVPYFKNDLSMIFWIIIASILMTKSQPEK
ncbi:MAG: hypothetical protein COU29_02000 [Candidatus Magasanikbacteria bacterium CG10_big_fil_rev_8_21_14_0_10_36_32]|uniref:O-antigen ligase-related domain-containing protein n=1 Tax=Candidatus Magasanikbacteria bacterium CG10_big_fil_rev_8_21_14_0_10_36_32 TaxID=1974646 RepID=A0A2M6W6Y4_9BACT|nr:MAG: hypothetical protein COU29_02000 [Candidatus Magasanikbacteria bacterium CG10_big_fil_rev_8_21_14_0_10_36_32]